MGTKNKAKTRLLNDKFEYSLGCGCKAINTYITTGHYKQEGETYPIREQRWDIIHCSDPKHKNKTLESFLY